MNTTSSTQATTTATTDENPVRTAGNVEAKESGEYPMPLFSYVMFLSVFTAIAISGLGLLS